MADGAEGEKDQSSDTPGKVRLQVPALILPLNQSIAVLSPTQQQKLGLDISQLISGQQLHLLASHLSGTSAGQHSQPVIIVPEAIDGQADGSSSSFVGKDNNSEDLPGPSCEIPTSLNVAAKVGAPSTSVRRGRPNKFVALETGEIVKQQSKPPQPKKTEATKRPRGRPRKEKSTETSNGVEGSLVGDRNSNFINDDGDNLQTKSMRGKRKRILEGDSDYEGSKGVGSDIEDVENTRVTPSANGRPRSERSQRLRRSVVRNIKYADYEVEDLPERPENVWINETDSSELIADNGSNPLNPSDPVQDSCPVDSQPIRHEGSTAPNSIKRKGKRGRPRILDVKLEKKNQPVQSEDKGDTVLTETEINDCIVCGACNTHMPREKFLSHRYKQHNGLTWIEGEEVPIDFRNTTIENQNYLSNLIRDAFQIKGKGREKGGQRQAGKFLSCENCEHQAYSAVGYLSHFRFCNISEEERLLRMWKCPICNRVMMPSSRYSHEVQHANNKGKEHEKAEIMSVADMMEVDTVKTPRRKAAVKAESCIQDALDKDNEELGGPADPLKLGFKRPKIVTKGIGAIKAAWRRQLSEKGTALCRHLGCHFTSSDLQELQKHYVEECPFKPEQVYQCIRCSVHCSSEAEIINHISVVHRNEEILSEADDVHESDDLSAFECSDNEAAPEKKSTRKKTPKQPNANVEKVEINKGGCALGMGYSLNCMMPYWAFRNKVPYRPVLKWMLEFCKQNFSDTILFPDLITSGEVKPLEDADAYLPVIRSSVNFCTSRSLHPKVDLNFISKQTWHSMPTFTGIIENGVPLLFAGGPISSLAWCPTPVSANHDQIIALTCHRSMDAMPIVSTTDSSPGLVQVWNLGALDNFSHPTEVPRFILGLGHTWGTIRQIAWCPSGCWAPKLNLHGVLAAACSDGSVRIVSIIEGDPNMQFIEAKASLTLLPHSLVDRRSPCLRVSWYSGKGHSFIAGGFADGLICLWKITNSPQLLRNVDCNEGSEELHPYLRFQAHTGPITALELSSIGNCEPRYLYTGSISDKNMTYWDLEKLGEVSLGNYPRKARVTDSTLMSLWPLATSSFEDAQFGTTFIPPRNFCRHFMVLPHNSSALSLDKGDWLNGIAQSTLAGEICIVLLNQLLFGMDNEKFQREKRALLTRTCVANLQENHENESNKPLTYVTYQEAGQHGVIFCDVGLDSDHVWCKESKSAQLPEKMDSCPSINYPLAAINRVTWNPNSSSFGWLAAGYQCGIVRIVHIKCKSSDQIIRSSLQKEAGES